MSVQNVLVLGVTGSIGSSTVDIIRRHPDKYRLYAATAATNVDKLLALCHEFEPVYVAMSDTQAAKRLAAELQATELSTQVLQDADAQQQLASATEVDMVMAAIVGAAGLAPTFAAVTAGKKVLLANKESLVTAGQLFMQAVQNSGATLLPIDSEHNAIFQCLPAGKTNASVAKVLLTASGGPFRTRDLASFAEITPAEACAHPNWSMGQKISVDSATMMNKGLELIEACWLFEQQADAIEVLIHPQSIVHSMVSYIDGSVLAQLGQPDMRTPIAYGMAYPQRIEAGVELLDLITAQDLSFEQPDHQRFPMLSIARQAWQAGGSAATIMNAANEVAVAAFLQGRISFLAIAELVQSSLAASTITAIESLEHVYAIDTEARATATALLKA